jgi:hypothetical protein
MIALLTFLLMLLVSPFKSKRRLEAENAALRQQLTVLQRKAHGRVQFTNSDVFNYLVGSCEQHRRYHRPAPSADLLAVPKSRFETANKLDIHHRRVFGIVSAAPHSIT